MDGSGNRRQRPTRIPDKVLYNLLDSQEIFDFLQLYIDRLDGYLQRSKNQRAKDDWHRITLELGRIRQKINDARYGVYIDERGER